MTATQDRTILSKLRITYIIKTYNRIASRRAERLEELPDFVLKHLIVIPYNSLIVPFVIEDADKGNGRPFLASKYGITPGEAREILKAHRGRK